MAGYTVDSTMNSENSKKNMNQSIFTEIYAKNVLQVTGVVLPAIPEVSGGGTILTWIYESSPYF